MLGAQLPISQCFRLAGWVATDNPIFAEQSLALEPTGSNETHNRTLLC